MQPRTEFLKIWSRRPFSLFFPLQIQHLNATTLFFFYVEKKKNLGQNYLKDENTEHKTD